MIKYSLLLLFAVFFFRLPTHAKLPDKTLTCKSIDFLKVLKLPEANLLTMVRKSDSTYSIRCAVIDDDGFVSIQLLAFLLEKEAAFGALEQNKKNFQDLDPDEKKELIADFKLPLAWFKSSLKDQIMQSEIQGWATIKPALLKNLSKLISYLESPKRLNGPDSELRRAELNSAKGHKARIEELNAPVKLIDIYRLQEFLKSYQNKHTYNIVCKDPEDENFYHGNEAIASNIAVGRELEISRSTLIPDRTAYEDGLDNSCTKGISGNVVAVARSMLAPEVPSNPQSPLIEKNGTR